MAPPNPVAWETRLVSGVMMVVVTRVVSTRVMDDGVMSGVAMMLVGCERRGGKHHQEEGGGKNLLHGTNLTRCSRPR